MTPEERIARARAQDAAHAAKHAPSAAAQVFLAEAEKDSPELDGRDWPMVKQASELPKEDEIKEDEIKEDEIKEDEGETSSAGEPKETATPDTPQSKQEPETPPEAKKEALTEEPKATEPPAPPEAAPATKANHHEHQRKGNSKQHYRGAINVKR